jgi:hypothetical protein
LIDAAKALTSSAMIRRQSFLSGRKAPSFVEPAGLSFAAVLAALALTIR